MEDKTRKESFKTKSINNFDEKSYLEANPAIEKKIEEGLFTSVLDHLQKFGLKEIESGERRFHKDFKLYSEERYLQMRQDVKRAVEEGKVKSGFEHFCLYGYDEILQGSKKWPKIEKVIIDPVNNDLIEKNQDSKKTETDNIELQLKQYYMEREQELLKNIEELEAENKMILENLFKVQEALEEEFVKKSQ